MLCSALCDAFPLRSLATPEQPALPGTGNSVFRTFAHSSSVVVESYLLPRKRNHEVSSSSIRIPRQTPHAPAGCCNGLQVVVAATSAKLGAGVLRSPFSDILHLPIERVSHDSRVPRRHPG